MVTSVVVINPLAVTYFLLIYLLRTYLLTYLLAYLLTYLPTYFSGTSVIVMSPFQQQHSMQRLPAVEQGLWQVWHVAGMARGRYGTWRVWHVHV